MKQLINFKQMRLQNSSTLFTFDNTPISYPNCYTYLVHMIVIDDNDN